MEGLSTRTRPRYSCVTSTWKNAIGFPFIFRGALDGQADLCYWVPVIELGLMRLNTIMWLPMMGWPSEWAQSTIYPQLLEKFPQLKAEYRGEKQAGGARQDAFYVQASYAIPVGG